MNKPFYLVKLEENFSHPFIFPSWELKKTTSTLNFDIIFFFVISISSNSFDLNRIFLVIQIKLILKSSKLVTHSFQSTLSSYSISIPIGTYKYYLRLPSRYIGGARFMFMFFYLFLLLDLDKLNTFLPILIRTLYVS